MLDAIAQPLCAELVLGVLDVYVESYKLKCGNHCVDEWAWVAPWTREYRDLKYIGLDYGTIESGGKTVRIPSLTVW